MVNSTWERLVTRTGGTVAALVRATAADGESLVLAGTTAGVFRSSDGGRSWQATSETSPLPFVEALASSLSRDRAIFAGTRNGLYRSRDEGKSWQVVLVGSRMLALAVTPTRESACTLFVGTETDGILHSDDEGQTWNGANAGLLDLTVLALAFSPRFEQDRTGFAATASGLYRSRNGGRSWRAVDVPIDEPAVQCLAVSPVFAEDRLALAGTEEHGLLRSDDGGATWESVPELEGAGVTAIAFSASYPSRPTIALATGDGVVVSRDRGRTWSLAGQELGPALSLTCSAQNDGAVLLAGLPTDGVARSTDDATSWQPSNEGLTANLVAALVPSPAFADDRTLFAAGLQDGVRVSTDGGETWQERNAGLDDPTVLGLAVSPDFARNRTLFAATGVGIYRSRDGATTWEPVQSGVVPTTLGALIATPAPDGGASTILAGVVGGHLLVSTDDGQAWRTFRPFEGAELIAFAVSPEYARDRTIFVGTSQAGLDGGTGELTLWRSTDGGESWERWLATSGASMLPLAVPSTYPLDGTLFVGIGRSITRPMPGMQEVRSGKRQPIWGSVDVAQTSLSVTSLAASPAYRDDGALFVATSDGMYISRNRGQSFRRWSDDLSPPSVLSVAVSPAYATDRLVFAVGLDGTIWRRRDS